MLLTLLPVVLLRKIHVSLHLAEDRLRHPISLGQREGNAGAILPPGYLSKKSISLLSLLMNIMPQSLSLSMDYNAKNMFLSLSLSTDCNAKNTYFSFLCN